MNWAQLVKQMTAKGLTLEEIALTCGFASRGALHDLTTRKSTTCSYERGIALLEMHKRVMRRKART